MEEKSLINIESDEFSGVIVERSTRRKKGHPILKLLLVLVFVALVFLLYKYHQDILNFFNSFNAQNPPINTENSDTPPGNLVEDDKNNIVQPPQDDTIPDGAYPVLEETILEHSIINESECNFESLGEFSFPLALDIYQKYGNDAPVVLITHFSVRECYSNGSYYFTSDSFYSDEKNVGSIGALLCQQFNDLGLNAIHLNDVFASGAIFNSQKEYSSALSQALEKYPSISYVINLSRGTDINKDLSMNKYVTYIDNMPCAQLNIVSGTNFNCLTKNQENNICFATELGMRLNEQHSGIVKSNVISRFALSQDYEPTCLEIEIGGYGNSYKEAENAINIFARAFYDFLKN